MPEGDSIHRVATRLRVLVGERVSAEARHPRAGTAVAAAVDGRLLEAVEAVGKNLLLRFEGGVTVRSHLRMSGRWRLEPRGTLRKGRPWLVLRGREWEAVQWNGPVLVLDDGTALRRLGPDLLAATTEPADVVRRLRSADQDRPLGELLVDQRLVAGIGNMWLAECLWQAQISPWLPAGEASDGELHAALRYAQEEMRRSLAARRRPRSVYRRAGRPCARCGATICARGLGHANRTAYWCPGCQRGPGVVGAGERGSAA